MRSVFTDEIVQWPGKELRMQKCKKEQNVRGGSQDL
jgi:hypothetical protein